MKIMLILIFKLFSIVCDVVREEVKKKILKIFVNKIFYYV